MSKFIVITKRELIKTIFLLFLLICLFLLLYTLLNSDKETMNSYVLNSSKEFKKDFNGDGIEDILLVESENNSYMVKIKILDKEYLLLNSNYSTELIDISPYYDIKFDFIDLNRDNVPEIIINGLKNKNSITYIFNFVNNNFKETYESTNNIFGILNYSNSRTPFIINTQSSKGDSHNSAILYNNSIVKNIDFSNSKINSLSTIQKFIDIIQLDYELDDTPNIFADTISSDELSILWSLNKETTKYNFQYGYYKDISWRSSGTPKELLWLLSFEKAKKDTSEELLLLVNIKLNDTNEYKISSIQVIN